MTVYTHSIPMVRPAVAPSVHPIGDIRLDPASVEARKVTSVGRLSNYIGMMTIGKLHKWPPYLVDIRRGTEVKEPEILLEILLEPERDQPQKDRQEDAIEDDHTLYSTQFVRYCIISSSFWVSKGLHAAGRELCPPSIGLSEKFEAVLVVVDDVVAVVSRFLLSRCHGLQKVQEERHGNSPEEISTNESFDMGYDSLSTFFLSTSDTFTKAHVDFIPKRGAMSEWRVVILGHPKAYMELQK
eukprot:scaffold5376_cov171-Amphora_coffeaeformis.AAC.9